jgi:hypothetical protein
MAQRAECLGTHGAVGRKTGYVEIGEAFETLEGVVERVGSVDHFVDLLGLLGLLAATGCRSGGWGDGGGDSS